MCRTPETIMKDDFIIKEIDEHLEHNNLEELDRLMLRVMKYNRIDVLQVKDDVEPLKDCVKHPSLSYRFKHETGKVLLEWAFILGSAYFMFRVVEILSGLEGLLKLLAP
jgi:hypothetical protein